MSDNEAVGRQKKPFDAINAAHLVARVAESLDWNLSDTEAFLRRAQHVEYGLSAEIEFAAILRWLGVCKLVHRLSEDCLTDPALTDFTVPDLFTLFESRGHRQGAVIEVKTSETITLKMTPDYLAKLSAYASLVQQPLLIAWRPRDIGLWVLFDPNTVPIRDGEFHVGDAIANSLMGMLAGDFSLVPMANAGLRFVAKRVGEKEPTEDGYTAVFQIVEATFRDADGNEAANVPRGVSSLVLATMQHSEEIDDDTIVKSFTTSEGMTSAQLVLRAAVGFPLKEDERIHWRAVVARLDKILAASELLTDSQQNFGSFVRNIFFLRPQIVPDYLGTWPDLFAAQGVDIE
jgi:Holliday junction resolvase